MLFGVAVDVIALFVFMIFYFEENFSGIFASIIVFFFAFQISLGSVAWIYLSEIMDHGGIAHYSIFRWFWTFVVGLCTPYMIVYLGVGGTFGLYGALTFVTLLYFFF